MIYFGDPDLVEKHLHEDLNTIIKNVKIRQQQHLQLLEYNKSIVNKKRNIQSTIFINDEITTHNKFLHKIQQINSDLLKQQKSILQKYDEATVKYQTVIRLMSRVVTRILQTNQSYIDKIKIFDEHFNEQFLKMKTVILKLVNNKECIDLSHSTKVIVEYAQHKAVNQIEKLTKLIKSLDDGEVDKIPYIYKGIIHQELKRQQTKKQEKSPLPHYNTIIQVEKAMVKKQQRPERSISKMKQQIKHQEKVKKQRKNFVNKLIGMYSTMDLSKKQFMEDLTFNNAKEQYERLYNEIFQRNKFNHDQILEFQNRKDQFEEKVRLFKEIMTQESNRIQEVLMIKKPVKLQRKQDVHSESTSKLEIIEEENKNPQIQQNSSVFIQNKKGFILRQKVASPRFHKQTQLTQLRITQEGFNHIKFDANNEQIFLRSNRNRLPSIQTKPYGSSITPSDHHRYQNLSKNKQEKTQRKNFLMKNIEVGVQNVVLQNKNKNKSESRHIADKIKQINSGSSINNSTVMEFTFYGSSKKKNYILGDTRTNFAF